MSNIYLYGASGHAKVIIEILECNGINPAGLFDDNLSIHQLLNYSVQPYPGLFNYAADQLIISIGNNIIRKKIADQLKVPYAVAIHPSATLSKRSTIGAGSVVMAGVTINADTYIGQHSIINTNASVDHDCVLEDFVHISPNVALCGNVQVGEGTHIGAGAIVIPGIKIGKWCTIGAGAVVIRDVTNNTKIVGNPGRIIKTLKTIE